MLPVDNEQMTSIRTKRILAELRTFREAVLPGIRLLDTEDLHQYIYSQYSKVGTLN